MAPYSAILDHLRKWKSRLEARALDQKWYELQQAQFRYTLSFDHPKIVYPDIAMEPRFTLDVDAHYIDMTGFVIPSDDLFLLGVLNSVSIWSYLSHKAAVLGDTKVRGRLRLKRQYMQHLPIPIAPEAEQRSIITLVQLCLDDRGQGKAVTEWEAEINERVARLYGI